MKSNKYGFLEPVIDDTNYVLGGLGVEKKILNPSGRWLNFLPQGEIQKRNIETSSCTEYGTLNAIETIENLLYGKNSNYSERYISILAENSPAGNDPHKVAETIRKWGLIDEKLLAFTDQLTDWIEYMTPSPLPNNLTSKGLKWVEQNYFKHEWVFRGGTLEQKQKALLEALKYSPVGVSVYAWEQKGDVFVKGQQQDNHWCLLVDGDVEKPWTVLDSYIDDGTFLKKLDWNYSFGYAKLYILKKADTAELEKKSILDFLKKYWEELFR